ncbi:MAG: hypothetical protein IKV97_06240 [Clostridia bacterium]|nr:hypothetical protein [Clostridia bacterium]
MNTENGNRNSLRRLCENVAEKHMLRGESTSSGKLYRIIKTNLRDTRRIYLKASKKASSGAPLTDSFLWLTDNFSFIEETFLVNMSALRKMRGLRGNNGIPCGFTAAYELCTLCEGAMGRSHFDVLVEECDAAQKGGLGYDDFESFPVLINCAVLCYIGKLCTRYTDGEGVFENSSAGECLISAIKTLKRLSVHNYTEAFSKCGPEKILLLDPSGIYPKMTEDTKAVLRDRVKKQAKKAGSSDSEYASKMLNASSEHGDESYIGAHTSEGTVWTRLYYPLLFIFSFILSVFFAYKTVWWLFLFIIFPVYEGVSLVLHTLISATCSKSSVLPEIKISEIPDNAKTLCVITSLLRGEQHDAELFSRLERIYNANGGKNIKFGVLGDLSDCDSATKSTDDAVCSYASGRIDSLNAKYGNEFVFFIRPRSYSKSEKCFMAYERKRGAVIELVKLIRGEKTSFDMAEKSLSENLEFLRRVKYVITLDADTNLGLDTASRLVGKMIHPQNRAVIDKKTHKVVSGYGMMQPKMSTELASARATPFSRLMCGGGGTDIYSGASFDLYQNLFDAGSFCGKGIFDAEAFYETVVRSEFFPEDSVLSHDIPEGERLRTALLTDVELTDGFPKNELSYLKRKHRWIRGDIQNSIFLKNHITVDGTKRKNDFGILSRFKLADNIRRALTSVFSLTLLICSLFLDRGISNYLFVAAFLPYLIPFAVSSIVLVSSLAFRSAARKFFSKGVTVGIWQSFLKMLYLMSMLAKDALLSAGAALTSAYRMFFSRRKLLEWVTAAQSDSGSSTPMLFISRHIASSFIGAVLFVFSSGGLIKIAGIMFFIMPVLGYFTAKDMTHVGEIKEYERKKLGAYALDIWKFFSENVTSNDNFLPPDNISLSPYEKIAHRTSPTNIGLYIASLASARDFGFIDSKTLFDKMSDTLDTVEKLPKWKGHLYNWYDTEKLTVLNPPYVSSVDSGNFTACLICARGILCDYTGEEPGLVELINRISSLISAADYGVLYNSARGLFSVGAAVNSGSAELDDGCYDFLMSEARILSYVAASSRVVPKEHWKKLGRPLITSDGYIGMASWSGTAFEYFMPALFMPHEKGSFLYEAMLFACKAQSVRRAGKVWGISESGFFSFDCDMNYQYKAFGVPLLGQKNGLEDDLVISPYSTFISMCVSRRRAMENLDNLSKLGVYGKYGFYEALDFTKTRVRSGFACVKSYMSHHLGMSFLALSNAANDGAVMRRFMSDSKMACGRELLEESIPVNAVIKRLRKTSVTKINFAKHDPEETIYCGAPTFSAPAAACISDGKTSCIVSNLGHVRISKGDVMFTVPDAAIFPAEEPQTLRCLLKLDGRVYGMTPIAARPNSDSKFAFSYTESVISSSLSCDKGSFELCYTVSNRSSSAVRMRLHGESKAQKSEFSFVFCPCISSGGAYLSHPAFSELFICAEYDENEKILFFKRRRRNARDEEYVLAVALSDKNADINFATMKNALGGRNVYSDPFAAIEYCECGKTGACVSPLCIISGQYRGEAELIMLMAHGTEEAKGFVANERKCSFHTAAKALCEVSSQFTMSSGISSVGSDISVREMLSGMIFGNAGGRLQKHISESAVLSDKNSFGIDNLWRNGISGDYPIVLVDAGGVYFPLPLERRIRAFKLLTMKNVRFDLVIAYRENDKYERKNERKIRNIINACACSGYLGRKCGIHIVEKGAAEDIPALRYAASCVTEIYSDTPQSFSEISQFSPFYPITKGKAYGKNADGFAVAGGVFCDGGFLVDKENKSHVPWSHTLSGKNISCIVTENSLGNSFYKNASEMKITPRSSSGTCECMGERLYLSENGVVFDLVACSHSVLYSCGKAEYFGSVAVKDYKITVFCDEVLPVKVINAEFFGNFASGVRVFMGVHPVMGAGNGHAVCAVRGENTVVFKNPMSESFGNYTGFVSVQYDGNTFSCNDKTEMYSLGKSSGGFGDIACVGAQLDNTKCRVSFLLGAYKDGADIPTLVENVMSGGKRNCLEKAVGYCRSLMPDITFLPGNKDTAALSIEKMFNTFLPYDAVFSRMIARSGFYQSGGAYGFRDQLQDSLLLLYSQPGMTKTHICRAAAHQFEMGDVTHWWHSCTHRGVRTLCSDDYLWLPYVCCEYKRVTGDGKIFDIEIPYICGEELQSGEGEKYIPFENSKLKESLYLHCVRAIELACKRVGGHGLGLMGTCDWCDGYSTVGNLGKGESVWCSMFLVCVLDSFKMICFERGDDTCGQRYGNMAENLKKAIIKNGYDRENGYFIRGYYDDGTVLGSNDSDECKIDILPQCFAILCGMPKDMCKSALEHAYKALFDKEYGITKLFSPPFDKTKKEPGYIKGYIPGVRENGGQYTHGALFGAMGFFECAKAYASEDPGVAEKLAECGAEILMYCNPAYRSGYEVNEKIRLAYKTEPYATAADIYSNKDHIGRGGWTHYTGASAWLYRLLLKYAFGLEFENTETSKKCIRVSFVTSGAFERVLDGAVIRVREFGFDTEIKYIADNRKEIICDGKTLSGNAVMPTTKKVEIHFG